MGLFKHKITALAGVVNYLEKHYPESEAYKGIKTEKIGRTYVSVNYKSVNDLMKEFRLQHSDKLPSKNIDRNAEFIQRNWQSFTQFLKQKSIKNENNF